MAMIEVGSEGNKKKLGGVAASVTALAAVVSSGWSNYTLENGGLECAKLLMHFAKINEPNKSRVQKALQTGQKTAKDVYHWMEEQLQKAQAESFHHANGVG